MGDRRLGRSQSPQRVPCRRSAPPPVRTLLCLAIRGLFRELKGGRRRGPPRFASSDLAVGWINSVDAAIPPGRGRGGSFTPPIIGVNDALSGAARRWPIALVPGAIGEFQV